MKKHVEAYARDCWFRFDFRFVVLACCDVEETSDGFQCRLERTKPRERERERSVLVFFSLKGEKNTRKREIFSQPFFAGVLGAVVRSRRGDDIVVFSVRAVLLLLMPMPMLVFLSLSRFTLTYDAHTALHIFLDRSIQKRKSTAVAIEEEETHFNFDCMF